MKKILLSGVLTAIAMGLMVSMNSCSDSDKESGNTGGGTKMAIPYMNISNTGGLITTDNVSGNNFFQVTKDGEIKEVEFVSSQAQTKGTSSFVKYDAQVTKMIDLNDDYLYLAGYFKFTDTSSTHSPYLYVNNLLVNRKTGAMYEWGSENAINCTSDDAIQRDGYGNIYYLGYGTNVQTVKKANLSNPASITIENYLPEGQGAYTFVVDSKGNCLYANSSSFQHTPIKVRLSEGGIRKVDIDNITRVWIGSDDDIYCIRVNQSTWPGSAEIDKIVNNNGVFSTVAEWSSDESETVQALQNGSYSKMLKSSNSELLFLNTSGYSKSFTYSESSKQVTLLNSLSNISGDIVVSSKKHYYIAQRNKTYLYKIPFSTHEPENLLDGITGDYELYTMDVDSYDNITFSALRYLDGKKILCYVTNQGEVSVTEDSSYTKVTVLKKLN